MWHCGTVPGTSSAIDTRYRYTGTLVQYVVSFSCGPQIFLTEGNPWLQAILKSLLNRINLINFFLRNKKQGLLAIHVLATFYFLSLS